MLRVWIYLQIKIQKQYFLANFMAIIPFYCLRSFLSHTISCTLNNSKAKQRIFLESKSVEYIKIERHYRIISIDNIEFYLLFKVFFPLNSLIRYRIEDRSFIICDAIL